jgi:type IX secretion system PorP/SprF family membrane protein
VKLFFKLFVGCLLIANQLQAQDFIFSNYSYVGYYINPALPSLIEDDLRVQAKFRGQWETFANAYKTVTTSIDFSPLNNDNRFCGKKLVISPQIIQDMSGSLKMSVTSLNLNIAYSQFLDRYYKSQLMLGLQSGYSFRSIDLSKAKVGSEYFNSGEMVQFSDPHLMPKSNYVNLAVGLGMAFYPNKNFNYSIGVSAYNLLGQNITFFDNGYSKENARYAGYFNTNYHFNDINSINGYLIFQMQGPFKSYIGGATWGMNFGKQKHGEWVNEMFFGGGIRWNDAVIATFGYGNENFTFAFNYDINYSKLIKSSRSVGAFELSFAYQTNWFKSNQKCPKPINCATFR